MIIFFAHLPLEDIPLFCILSISAGLVCVGVRLICHSLAFWGTSGDAGENSFMAFQIVAINPQEGFSTVTKLFLLTLFPAGYVGLVPVEIFRHFRWDYLALQLIGSFAIFFFSLWLFKRGVKRYESGNGFIMLR